MDLDEVKANTAYPMLLEWYEDYTTGKWSQKDFLRALRLVESYVFRRTVCGIASNSHNKTFLFFNKNLDKNNYLESVTAAFQLLPSYKRFPCDVEFTRQLMVRNMYNTRRSYWPRKLENFGRKEPVSIANFSIEHIMPQNKNLSVAWQKELGADWQRVHEEYIHNLGNLTLTGYNSEYSDKPFSEKKNMKGGLAESPLHLNAGIAQEERWNEDAINRRAKKLSGLAVQVWGYPELAKEIVLKYQPKDKAETGHYTLDDHPYLDYKDVKPLFQALRKEILALDESVTEEILKIYIAYKAETNFVDIIPLAKSLKLILNMKFPDINDPKGMCKDLTGISNWGNGDIEVSFDNLEKLPYIMTLIRQSLNSQIGDD